MPITRLLLLALLLVLLPVARPATAEEPPVLPTGDRLVLDGKPTEKAWQGALTLSADAIAVPAKTTNDEAGALTPRVRLLMADGKLWLAVEMDEDPGPGMGVVLFVAGPKAESAGDATAIAYRPFSLRTLRWAVRGAKGVGRQVYPCAGAADMSQTASWSLELSAGLAALAPADAAAPLRVAVMVITRAAAIAGGAPKGSMYKGPAAWQPVRPPNGAWPADAAYPLEDLAAEDAADVERHKAWIEYLKTSAILDKQQPRGGPEKRVRGDLEELLFTPLDAVLAARPDLKPSVEVIKAEAYRQLGLIDDAEEHYSAALLVAKGWREAQFGLAFHVALERWISAPAGGPSDYGKGLDRVIGAVNAGGKPLHYFPDAAMAGMGILQYKHGSFGLAKAALDRVAPHYPMHRVLQMVSEHARKAVLAFAAESSLRRRDEKASLPRAEIVTTRGRVVVELFQNDAPGAVNNFVWLARKGFFDGMRWHHTVPYLVAQSGDPFSKDGADASLVGAGGPGYEIRAEASKRMAVRGALVMMKTGAGTVASQFGVLTGTAIHAKDGMVVFGRVLEGQEHVERLTTIDRIKAVKITRATEGWDYTPRDLAQQAPKEPVAKPAGIR